ncbi:MAG: dienelactone hydrolase family protein [Candidatus Levybacteria bacterium]|nr:dienelactone hydrolase family protein [Candidatus Levybacteria bacterium]
MKRLAKKNLTKVIFALILIFILSTQIQPTRAFYQAVLTAPELIQNFPLKPLIYLTNKPKVKEVVIKSSNREIYADLYIPNDREKHPAAVLDLGLDIDRKDPRVVKVAETFARNEYIILAPNIPYLSSRRLTTTAVEDFIASYKFLENQPNVKKNKIGFIGFCTSGGLTLIAAENEKISQKVSFVVAINPYFDLKSLYIALTIREVEGQKWTPHFKSVEVFNREAIALLDKTADQTILFNNLVNISEEDLAKGNFPKLLKEDELRLSKAAIFTYHTLTNKDSDKSTFYLENAQDSQKEFLISMSPSTNIQKLNAKTYIFAEKGFNYIPYTEARRLSRKLEKEGKYLTYQEISVLPQSIQEQTFKEQLVGIIKLTQFIFGFFKETN